jgi:hypothetical protein
LSAFALYAIPPSQAKIAEMGRRILGWVAALTVISLFVVSLLPIRPRLTLHGTPGHPVLHILVFAFTTFLCLLLATSLSRRTLGLFCLFALALAIEACQCIVFHQHMEWTDVFLDCLGSVLAFGLIPIGQALAHKTFWTI